eukprot:gnl/TRDRNA2_/TRDRNA2_37414_c0_seq1.p2 gnl/TRDRNA2_/TRDRNA2_37414_c0~~gnl/TRDRNA2_/TRDRNA2_37414_c0_seq1.p2  ORF type:complete len:125 (+),score=16.99 gnl/TRDRNA2_/TRDRNA2_37414_c0_seq1:81-455(+)
MVYRLLILLVFVSAAQGKRPTEAILFDDKEGHRWTASLFGDASQGRQELQYTSLDGESVSASDMPNKEWVSIDGEYVTFDNGQKVPYQSTLLRRGRLQNSEEQRPHGRKKARATQSAPKPLWVF